MQTISAKTALLAYGWADDVTITVGDDGRIAEIVTGAAPEGTQCGILLPAPGNLHSHAFQRAMAGLTEMRGPTGHDSFWTWRDLMFRFLDHLTPEDMEAIAALVQMEMLEAGFSAVGEFHYVHHQPGGAHYNNIAELAIRIVAAASETGIGLTLLPVFYQQGGTDGRPLVSGQVRFGNDAESFGRLFDTAKAAVNTLPHDCLTGVAPHSLRAVSKDGLAFAAGLAPSAPVHIHIAEQTAEVDEISVAYGARPVEWLFANHGVNERWCLIHATHMQPHETETFARSGAVAGLCPITESSLGDGIFDGVRFLNAGGVFGVGSDSNIRIALMEELRTLEYSQRLRDRARAVLARPDASTGRVLYETAARGSARALRRDAGVLDIGRIADMTALDADAIDMLGRSGDTILDSGVFAAGDKIVTDVWSAGRHVVSEGRHIRRDQILAKYRTCIGKLMERV